jgi:hypothetical protein
MCEHDFQLGADGEVRCIKCFVGDDEMELPIPENSDEVSVPLKPDFWASQVSFEE